MADVLGFHDLTSIRSFLFDRLSLAVSPFKCPFFQPRRYPFCMEYEDSRCVDLPWMTCTSYVSRNDGERPGKINCKNPSAVQCVCVYMCVVSHERVVVSTVSSSVLLLLLCGKRRHRRPPLPFPALLLFCARDGFGGPFV